MPAIAPHALCWDPNVLLTFHSVCDRSVSLSTRASLAALLGDSWIPACLDSLFPSAASGFLESGAPLRCTRIHDIPAAFPSTAEGWGPATASSIVAVNAGCPHGLSPLLRRPLGPVLSPHDYASELVVARLAIRNPADRGFLLPTSSELHHGLPQSLGYQILYRRGVWDVRFASANTSQVPASPDPFLNAASLQPHGRCELTPGPFDNVGEASLTSREADSTLLGARGRGVLALLPSLLVLFLVLLLVCCLASDGQSGAAGGLSDPGCCRQNAQIAIWPTGCGYCSRPTRDFCPPAPG
ncbi:hypothetical protein T08_12307 [Trichinella sp. T8]|nr:hypothetical protein T08_12307 [Trichinella sp. T8]